MKKFAFHIDVRALLRRLCEIATRRVGLKLISVFLALIIWMYIINTTPSLTRTKYVKDLSVSVSGSTTMNSYGLALASDPFSDYQNAVDVSVEVSHGQFSKVTNKNVIVTLDVSNIRSAGTYELPLNAVSVYGNVVRLYPDTVTINVEVMHTLEMPVDVVLSEPRPSEYWQDILEDSINPQQITVSGPASIVENVARVVATVDVTGQSTGFRRVVMLSIQDKNGEAISSRLLMKSASACSVSVDIYPQRELEVYIDKAQIPVEDGYVVDSITLEPDTVTVAAESELLSSLTRLPLDIPDTLTAKDSFFTTTLAISKLPNYKHISADKVYVHVYISEIQETDSLSDIPILASGLAEGLAYSVQPEVFSTQVSGPRSLVRALTAQDVYAYVDLTGLSEGEYELPVIIGNNPSLSYASLTPASVKVVISSAQTSGGAD